MKTFELFLKWYKEQKTDIWELKKLEQNSKYQWFINIYNNKLQLRIVHLLYLKYFEIHSQDKFSKCPFCNEYCGILKKFDEMKKYNSFFLKTCWNKECQSKWKQTNNVIEKRKQTKKEKYGDENYNNRTKAKETCLKNYNVDNPMKSEIIKENYEQKCFERYGVKHHWAAKSVIKIREQNYIKKYGVKHNSEIKEVVEKRKQTKKEKYSDENYNNRTKAKETCLKNYSVEYPLQNENILIQCKQTKKERYGDENYNNFEKHKQTKKEKYGDENYNNKIKAKETFISNYVIPFIKFKQKSSQFEFIDFNIMENILKFKCNLCDKEQEIICDEFIKQRLRLKYNVCQQCFPKFTFESSGELELKKFIESLGFQTEKYKELKRKHIDVYVPQLKLGFEYNGVYWHSTNKYKNFHKNYHINKTNEAKEHGIHLIHIYEDDWLHKQHIIKSMIRNRLGVTQNKIYARKTIIKEVEQQEAGFFLASNHLQGYVGAKHRYGLYLNDELVSLMTISSKGEIKRFCSELDTNVVGGFEKLFKYCKHLIKYTYVDLDWSSENNVYAKHFEKQSITPPTYWWVHPQLNVRMNRINYQKHKLVEVGWGTKDQTEDEIMFSKGYHKIYGCGNLKYENPI